MSHEAVVAYLFESTPYWWVVNLLITIEFPPSWISGSMNVSNHIPVLVHSTDHISMHNLDVIDVEEQPDEWRPNLTDNFGAVIHIVTLVARMAFHGMCIISGIEMFQANCNALVSSVFTEFSQGSNRIFRSLLPGKFSAFGIIYIKPLIACECNHIRNI